jgi:transposase
MPKETNPIFQDDLQMINIALSYQQNTADKSVYYFVNSLPVFSHRSDDFSSFRIISSQLIVNSICTNAEIQRSFGVTKTSVCRGVAKFKKDGAAAFYAAPGRRKGPVMTPEVLMSAQELLNDGFSRLEASEELGIKKDTLAKAIRAGKLSERPAMSSKKK